MKLVDRLRAARSVDRARFVPFVAQGVPLGAIRHDLADRLEEFPDVFARSDTGWTFVSALDDAASRTAAMADVARALSAAGCLTRWRDELYDIAREFGAPVLFQVERSAVRFFGFEARAVHVNGICGAAAAHAMWIARRSPSKPIDPGMYDNLVGGGLASGLSVRGTLVKEAFEEAGIDARTASLARAAGAIRIEREVPEGLHAETIFVYDLALPEHLVPCNQDGEVAEFRRLPIGDIVRELESGSPYTADAALVIAHFLVRHGYVTADDAPQIVMAPFV